MGAVERFRAAVAEALGDRSPITVAKSSGIERHAIRRVIEGRNCSLARAAEIAAALDIDFRLGPDPKDPIVGIPPWAQLLREDLELLINELRSSKVLPFIPAGEIATDDDEFEPVRRYDQATLRLAAGSHSFSDIESAAGEVRFRRDWLRAQHLQAANLVLLDASGDSMAPAIRDGDSILVDESRIKPVDGRVFAVRTVDGPLVKRLRRRSGRWWADSDNREHESRSISSEDRLLGMVVWWAHTE